MSPTPASLAAVSIIRWMCHSSGIPECQWDLLTVGVGGVVFYSVTLVVRTGFNEIRVGPGTMQTSEILQRLSIAESNCLL